MKIKTLFLLLSLNLVLVASLYSQTPQKGESKWKTFEDKKLGASFSYPGDFEVAVGEGATSADFSITLTPKKIPDKYRDSYEFRISKGATPGSRCDSWEKATDDKPPKNWPKTKMIGGFTLNLYTTAEGSMGGHTDITFGYSGTSKKGCLGSKRPCGRGQPRCTPRKLMLWTGR